MATRLTAYSARHPHGNGDGESPREVHSHQRSIHIAAHNKLSHRRVTERLQMDEIAPITAAENENIGPTKSSIAEQKYWVD